MILVVTAQSGVRRLKVTSDSSANVVTFVEKFYIYLLGTFEDVLTMHQYSIWKESLSKSPAFSNCTAARSHDTIAWQQVRLVSHLRRSTSKHDLLV